MTELRACDCGAEDGVEVHAVGFEERGATGEYQTAYGGFAQCTKCRRRGPNGVEAASYDEAIAAAVTAWNYRPVEDALRAENKRLEARIEELEAALNHAINAVLVHALDAALDGCHE